LKRKLPDWVLGLKVSECDETKGSQRIQSAYKNGGNIVLRLDFVNGFLCPDD